MPATKRATIYFAPMLHRELRRRAAACEMSISKYVNDAVRDQLEDDFDLEELERRRNEPGGVELETFVRDLNGVASHSVILKPAGAARRPGD